MGAHNSSAEILFSLHYPTSQLFPSDARFARWIASLSWSWLSNPKALSVFTSLPALQTVKSGWPRGRIIPPSSLEVVVVPCGACRTTSFWFLLPFFQCCWWFWRKKDAEKEQKTLHNSLFCFFCFFLICWRSTNIIFLMQFLSVFAVSQTGQDALVLPSLSEGFEEVLTIHTFEDR